jgi:hypothetical protein
MLQQKMTPARDICDLLEARASSGRIAFEISKTLFAKINAILRRRFPVSYQDAELLLVDLEREHEDVLFCALRDTVHVDDATDAVRRCLGDDQ